MRKSVEIKHVDIFSLFKMAFLVFACVGLILGFIAALVLLIVSSVSNAFMMDEEWAPLGMIGSVIGLVVVPIVMMFFYGAVWSVLASLVGALYNVFARFVGGIRGETFSPDESLPPVAAPPAPGGVDTT